MSAPVVAGPDDRTATSEASETSELISGWGRTSPSRARVAHPGDADGLAGMVRRPGAGVIARGLGRSYGDAAQCSGGLVLDTSPLAQLGEVDGATGTIEVGGGVSLHRLMQHVVPRGWFVAVTPGTRYVTVGGAIASDVHGKNHHCDGSFARHVLWLRLATPTGVVEVTPHEDPALFWATAGGMGLTGVVLAARLQLIAIETSWMQVDSRKHTDLARLMADMEEADVTHRYSVAWLDCLRHRDRTRRSVLTLGAHAPLSALDASRRAHPLEAPADPRLHVPMPAPVRLANRASVRLLNEGWFRTSSASEGALVPLTAYFHPLDGIAGWNLLYGPDGFLQYQFAVPPERGDVVEDAVAAIASSGVPSFLAVLKRFGPGTPGPLSFAQAGWTLALDFPVGPGTLPALLDGLDERVADAGGRVYLAKDARLRPELFPRMYPRLSELAAVRRRVDPDGVLTSDLAKRLGIP